MVEPKANLRQVTPGIVDLPRDNQGMLQFLMGVFHELISYVDVRSGGRPLTITHTPLAA